MPRVTNIHLYKHFKDIHKYNSQTYIDTNSEPDRQRQSCRVRQTYIQKDDKDSHAKRHIQTIGKDRKRQSCRVRQTHIQKDR